MSSEEELIKAIVFLSHRLEELTQAMKELSKLMQEAQPAPWRGGPR